MKILCIDIGTGTQDILLFDSSTEIENCLQLVMPSPTVLVANQIRAATRRGETILLTGSIMGGGPNSWAAEDHVRAGLPIFATRDAALSFNDELEKVEASGIRVVDDEVGAIDEGAIYESPLRDATRVEMRDVDSAGAIYESPLRDATRVVMRDVDSAGAIYQSPLRDATRVVMRDVDLDAIGRAFAAFGVPLEFDALAVAVFDHGNAPPEVSDRTFRFEFLAERIRATGKLSGFAFMRDDIPERLTRMRAVARSIDADAPLMVMDTAPAAVRGALDDDVVASHKNAIVANLGNFHALAFRFTDGKITGVFEHHSGELKPAQLENFLRQLADGTLTNEAIYNSQGHGAIMFDTRAQDLDFLAVTGPRRSMLRHSGLKPYFAVPYGAMMQAGNFGLLHAFADLNPNVADEIENALAKSRAVA